MDAFTRVVRYNAISFAIILYPQSPPMIPINISSLASASERLRLKTNLAHSVLRKNPLIKVYNFNLVLPKAVRVFNPFNDHSRCEKKVYENPC